jgi:hypothetical protein
MQEKVVRPSIEYASAVWDPFNKNQISQLDSVQRRAARFVSNNFQDQEPGAVTSIISSLKLADSTVLTYIWCYAVPGDDGTREEGKTIYICSCIYSPEGCNPSCSAGMSSCSAWIPTKLCTILYISVNSALPCF